MKLNISQDKLDIIGINKFPPSRNTDYSGFVWITILTTFIFFSDYDLGRFLTCLYFEKHNLKMKNVLYFLTRKGLSCLSVRESSDEK